MSVFTEFKRVNLAKGSDYPIWVYDSVHYDEDVANFHGHWRKFRIAKNDETGMWEIMAFEVGKWQAYRFKCVEFPTLKAAKYYIDERFNKNYISKFELMAHYKIKE